MAFRVELQGLKELKEELNSRRIEKKFANAVGRFTRVVHSEISSGVHKRYAIEDSLDKVLAGKSISNVKLGQNVLRLDLRYEFKPEPLTKFPLQETKVQAKAKYLVRLKSGAIISRDKNYALQLKAKILRSKGFKIVHGKHGFGAFLQRDSIGIRRVFERTQQATWTETLFERAPITPVWGPSLSQMAKIVYTREIKQEDLNRRLDEIINKIL